MRTLLIFYLLLTVETGACTKQNSSTMNCDQQNAKEITTRIIERKGSLKLNELTVDIQEDSVYFNIEYLPKDTMILGGGGKFKVLKSDCSIVSSKFYQ